jgi:carbon storage regulator
MYCGDNVLIYAHFPIGNRFRYTWYDLIFTVVIMLVITRNIGESVVIDNVVITVINSNGKSVQLGIEAPKSVSILRSELVRPKSDESELNPAVDSESNLAQVD